MDNYNDSDGVPMSLQCTEDGQLLCHDDGTLMAECCCGIGCGDSFDVPTYMETRFPFSQDPDWPYQTQLCSGPSMPIPPETEFQCTHGNPACHGDDKGLTPCDPESGFTYDLDVDCDWCIAGVPVGENHPCYNWQYDVLHCPHKYKQAGMFTFDGWQYLQYLLCTSLARLICGIILVIY